MALTLEHFMETFVLPLLGGGDLMVGRPLRPRDRDQLAGELHTVPSGRDLAFIRLRRAQRLTPHPALPDPDHGELSLWIALHNTLLFDHPERPRVWARTSTWKRVEGATRTLLTLPFPEDVGEGVGRHLAVGSFLQLRRRDILVTTPAGEQRFIGQAPPRRRFGFTVAAPSSSREDVVTWVDTPHAPEATRLIEDAMRASPLTCLWWPRRAPPGWSPLWGQEYLRHRGIARALAYHWASQSDWIAIGGAMMNALLPSVEPAAAVPDDPADLGPSSGPLALPGAVLPAGQEAIAAVVGALVHLHFLKVLELDARLGVALGSQDRGILSFLALPLLLPSLGGVTGTPLSGLKTPTGSIVTESFEAGAHRRFSEYVDHLAELVPRSTVENLLAGLVPAIVQTH